MPGISRYPDDDLYDDDLYYTDDSPDMDGFGNCYSDADPGL
ncbi:hypothetical protein [Streptosporangium canum]